MTPTDTLIAALCVASAGVGAAGMYLIQCVVGWINRPAKMESDYEQAGS